MTTLLSESFFNEIERKGDCLDTITLLIKQGIDINSTFKSTINGKDTIQSLLTYACNQNCTKIAKMLIERGANVNFKSMPDEDTPIHIACRKHNKELVSFLLQIPSINLKSLNRDNELCFTIALQTSQTEVYSMIIQAINANANANSKDNESEEKVGKENNKYNSQNCFNTKDIKTAFKYSNSNNGLNINSTYSSRHKEKIEIPFSFQNMDIASINSLNGIIKLDQTPSLMIDLDSLEKSETINKENKELKARVFQLEIELSTISNENLKLKTKLEEINALFTASKKEVILLKRLINDTISNQHMSCNDNQKNKNESTTNEDSHKAKDNELSNNSIIESNCNNIHENYLQLKFQSNKEPFEVMKAYLQKDLIDYKNYIKSNMSKTHDIIEQLVIQLQYAIDEISSNYEVRLYGSRATQLCLIWSDLDVVITERNLHRHRNHSPKDKYINPYVLLDLLSVSLNSKLWVSSLKYISTAKIPIIKLTTTEKYSSMQIDISIQNDNHCGLKCVDLVKTYLNEYKDVLEPLALAVKSLLKLSSLNDPFTGGLSSYGIILMIVQFLKTERAMNKPIGVDNLGELLCGFLYYYGGRIETNIVNVTDINMYMNHISPYDLVIIDPLNYMNNVGKSTYHYFNIKVVFLIALQALSEECPCACHYVTNSNNAEAEGVSTSDNERESVKHNALKMMFNAVRRGNQNGINNI